MFIAMGTMEHDTPEVILHLAGQGDDDALQQLLVHYHDRLRRTIAGRIASMWRRRIDADDIRGPRDATQPRACQTESRRDGSCGDRACGGREPN